jgi:hypothetical protein
MAAKQVYEILDAIKQLHEGVVNRVQTTQLQTSDQRLTNALKYIESHEKSTESILKDLDQKSREGVLKTYVRYYPIEIEAQANKLITDKPIHSPDDLLELLWEIKRKVIAIYNACGNGTVIPEVREFFEQLRDFEESQLNNFGRRDVELNQGY